jgi:GNAT superfamily N-acetyltransferase
VRSTAVPAWVLRGAPEPVLKLGRVAVDRRAQGRGLGTALVVDAFARAYAVSRQTPIAGLVTDPPAGVAGWLEGLGFRPVPWDSTAMLMPLGTIEALVEGSK